MNKEIAKTLPGITIPEDAIERLNLAAAAQKQMAYETQLDAQNMNAALFVGDMFGQALGQLAETGKVSFHDKMATRSDGSDGTKRQRHRKTQ